MMEKVGSLISFFIFLVDYCVRVVAGLPLFKLVYVGPTLINWSIGLLNFVKFRGVI